VISDEDDAVLLDEDGYPTEWGLRQIRGGASTPCQFVDLVATLWWTPQLICCEPTRTAMGKSVMQVRLATGGWSGNEVVIAELDRTFFSLLYWQSSHRGGLHIYEVPVAEWDSGHQLGLGALPGSSPTAQPASSVGGQL